MIHIYHVAGNLHRLRHYNEVKDIHIVNKKIKADLTDFELRQAKEHFNKIGLI